MSEAESILSNLSSNKTISESVGFLESSSLIAKLGFFILVIIVYILLLKLGITIISWIFSPKKNPHLITGMVSANELMIFPQDPSIKNAQTIIRSDNQSKGIEFTWSVWLLINDLKTNEGKYKHVFHKGNIDFEQLSATNENGLNFPNNAPGLYILPNTNALAIIMNTFNVINEEIIINDIPLNNWVNVVIRCKNTELDVYINGTIAKSLTLTGVPKQNYGDVYVALNGGFSGYISNLWYYDYAVGINEIDSVNKKGPNTKMLGKTTSYSTNYLSNRWYYTENSI
jgi:hypothetical protein